MRLAFALRSVRSILQFSLVVSVAPPGSVFPVRKQNRRYEITRKFKAVQWNKTKFEIIKPNYTRNRKTQRSQAQPNQTKPNQTKPKQNKTNQNQNQDQTKTKTKKAQTNANSIEIEIERTGEREERHLTGNKGLLGTRHIHRPSKHTNRVSLR